ncbi:hypothetical protein [Deinococcus planocerae]|uniref:hypothetical protein n=1 Tax=Deinococcus planocerae TaxID=1737569 RepID=UPI000C7EE2BB|nr:hypothetical protein [Deinococcus planocerae]
MDATPNRLSQAAADLGLPDHEGHQDWGIEFADPERLPEFVAYYRDHQATFDEYAQEYHLGELLLGSAREAIYAGCQPRSLIEEAVALVAARHECEPTQDLFTDWTGLTPHDWTDREKIAAVLFEEMDRE